MVYFKKHIFIFLPVQFEEDPVQLEQGQSQDLQLRTLEFSSKKPDSQSQFGKVAVLLKPPVSHSVQESGEDY